MKSNKLRDYAVLSALERSTSLEGAAQEIGCSYATVCRAVASLINQGRIRRSGTPRGGYTYEIVYHARA